MGNTFCHIDDEFANCNHDLSAVVSFAKNAFGVDINSTYRAKTNCGKFVRPNDLGWVLDYVFVKFDEEEFISEAKAKITERYGKMSLDGYFDLIDYPEFSYGKSFKDFLTIHDFVDEKEYLDNHDFDDLLELTRKSKVVE